MPDYLSSDSQALRRSLSVRYGQRLGILLTDISDALLRQGIRQISFFLGIEASRTLEQSTFEGVSTSNVSIYIAIASTVFLQTTPVAPFTGTTIKPHIGLAPILRAGLGMTDAMLDLFPWVIATPGVNDNV